MNDKIQHEQYYKKDYIDNGEGDEIMFPFFFYLTVELVGNKAGHAGYESSESA